MPITHCPLCKKKLSLKQIDFSTAVYICDDLKCKYPIGFQCIVVFRKLEDINKDIELLRADSTDNWVSDIVGESKLEEVFNKSPDNVVAHTNEEPKINVLRNDLITSGKTSPDTISDLIDNALSQFSSLESFNTTVSGELTQPVSISQISDQDFDDILDFMYDTNQFERKSN